MKRVLGEGEKEMSKYPLLFLLVTHFCKNKICLTLNQLFSIIKKTKLGLIPWAYNNSEPYFYERKTKLGLTNKTLFSLLLFK